MAAAPEASSPPWQYKWKNPQYWEIPSAFGSLPTIDHAAAEVNEDCILSVTLLGDDSVADRLCLSLIRSDTKTIDRSRTLQWPTQRTVTKQKDDTTIITKSGLVSVRLMRLPTQSANMNLEDAMDVLNFLSLDVNAMSLRNLTKDGEANESAAVSNKDKDVDVSASLRAKEDTSELFLACLTNKGKLHVYSPMELLDGAKEDSTKPGPPQLESAMTHFMFGQDLYDTLLTSVLPMSQPKHSVQVSLIGSVEESWLWDPTIERSTRPFYESGGGPMKATIIVQCLDYIAIVGSNDFMGFVTFVSISAWTEKRTLFIPMPIDSADAIDWGPLSLLVLTGGDMCLAVALNSMAVGRGQMLHENDPVGADAAALLPIQRFQLLLVQVPTGKCTFRNGIPPTCAVGQTEYEDLSYFKWSTVDTTTAKPGAFFDYHVGASTPSSSSMVIINTHLEGRVTAKAETSFLGSGYTIIAKPALQDGRHGGIEFVGWEGGTFRQHLTDISVKSMVAVVPRRAHNDTNVAELPSEQEEKDDDNDDDETTVQRAIGAISIEAFQQRRSSSTSSPLSSKKTSFALHEKSRRLLKQIPDDPNPYSQSTNSVSIVTTDSKLGWVSVRASPEPSPFRAVTSWLCEESEYFVAASLALLQHPETNSAFLHELWRHQQQKDISVLDGISHEEDSQIASDIVVACLLNGGYASTLEAFLKENKDYMPGKACIRLAAAGARAVDENQADLWPIRCLLGVGSSRDFLPSSLQLLNATLPDELRNGSAICKVLVSWIVSADAVDLLFDLTDERSRERYWMSLDLHTRQDLCGVQIDDSYPLLRFPEVRSWCVKELSRCIETEKSLSRPTDALPTPWLISLVQASMQNAGCQENWDQEASNDITTSVRKSLYPAASSGGLDFGLVVPALLLLAGRRIDSIDSRSIRSLLNAACYLAGRTKEVPLFALDSSLLMRHCTTMEDVEAAANLIGGENGLVLECCHILMLDIGLNMEEAEEYLLSNSYKLPRDGRELIEPFEFGDSPRRLARLLQEHVLSIRTYGEFETSNIRGRVDPVFAATLCLKTWWTITAENLSEATPWLLRFLREHLDIEGESISPHKLVCAALTRALIWPEEKDGTSGKLLASKLQLDSLFLFQLAQGCCGLVESLPPYVSDNGRVSPSPFASKSIDTFDESFMSANGSFPENEGSFRST